MESNCPRDHCVDYSRRAGHDNGMDWIYNGNGTREIMKNKSPSDVSVNITNYLVYPGSNFSDDPNTQDRVFIFLESLSGIQ
jgi:hypothetical protein